MFISKKGVSKSFISFLHPKSKLTAQGVCEKLYLVIRIPLDRSTKGTPTSENDWKLYIRLKDKKMGIRVFLGCDGVSFE